jgi:hypothetical protein
MHSESAGERLLNANQRRHYEALLTGLENTLAELETALDPAHRQTHDRVLTVMHDDLPPGVADAAGPRVTRARALIGSAASRWGLTAREASRRRAIRAALTAQLIRLEESSVGSLGGYGAIHPDAAAEVDPVLRELHEIVAELLALVRDVSKGQSR